MRDRPAVGPQGQGRAFFIIRPI
ncbi:hypothetical protein SGPA1_10502 [Streptomyces misionensis JCM 4497]